jgi:hypothetical protein
MKISSLLRRAGEFVNPSVPPGYTGASPQLRDYPIARPSRPPSPRR